MRRQRHRELQEAVEQYLTMKGWKFMAVSNYRCFKCGQVQNSKAKGWPDIFCYFPVPWAIEIKVGKDKLRVEQIEILTLMEEAGIPYCVVSDIDTVIENEPLKKMERKHE